MRTFDPTLLNEIANRPDVRPFLLGDGVLDLTQRVQNPANVTIVSEYGGFLAIQITPDLYEVHTIFTPEREGVGVVLELAKHALGYMFTHTGAIELVTRVAEDNRGAHIVATKSGFRDFAIQKELAPGISGKLMKVTLDSWVMSAVQPRLEGFSFHALIEEAKQKKHGSLPPHAEDERHDRHVGAAILMAKAGQTMKGFVSYNRSAFIYGYQPIRLLSETPAIVDTGDAIVGIENGDVTVMLCR